MKDKAYSYYKELPPWAKGVVIVGGLFVVYLAGNAILRKLKESKNARDAKDAVRNSEAEKRRLQSQGVRPSYPSSQYNTWANSIQQAFDGCDPTGQLSWGADSPLGAVSFWSTSGFKVAKIFAELKNDLDYLSLTTAWGIRTYDACGWFTGDVKDVDLAKAISDELTAREISNLNEILRKKGIKYKV
jgi:hypothetical protein